jgi:hypothetical protein
MVDFGGHLTTVGRPVADLRLGFSSPSDLG